MLASERDRADAARQGRIEPARLVFIDETWTKTNMAPLRGWGPRGQRLRAKVPQRRWKTMAVHRFRYMTLESIVSISDDPTVSLPVPAA